MLAGYEMDKIVPDNRDSVGGVAYDCASVITLEGTGVCPTSREIEILVAPDVRDSEFPIVVISSTHRTKSSGMTAQSMVDIGTNLQVSLTFDQSGVYFAQPFRRDEEAVRVGDEDGSEHRRRWASPFGDFVLMFSR